MNEPSAERPTSPQHRLTIELVPSTSWYANMRSVMTQKQWDVVRRQCYRDWNYQCGVCGAQGKINYHERWEYDDQNHVQTLIGFIALCDLCHHCKHLGLAGILARQGRLDFEAVVTHFCRVNGCSRADFKRSSEQAFAQWSERSTHPWRVDLGQFADMTDEQRLE